MPRNLILASAVVLLTGCAALVPSEKRVSQSVQATEAIHTETERTTERTLSATPEVVIASLKTTNSEAPSAVALPIGSTITEAVKVTTKASTGAGSKDKAAGSSEVSIPLGVKIAIFSVALGLLWLVIWLWRRTSPAVDAAIGAGDRAIASVIAQVETSISNATDQGELVKLNSLRAVMEKERGKLKGGA